MFGGRELELVEAHLAGCTWDPIPQPCFRIFGFIRFDRSRMNPYTSKRDR